MNFPLFIGKNLVVHNEVDSTNTHLLNLLQKEELFEGTVVVADHQLKGRGQQNNTWESEEGKNLLISILLRPTFLEARQNFMLNMTISLGLADFFQGLLPDKQINVKWPNDIFCGSRKLSGILIENNIRGSKITQSVVGIGVNVNQQNFISAVNATSLIIEAEEEFKREKLMLQLFGTIEKRYFQLFNGNFAALSSDYRERLYKKDVLWRYKNANDQTFEGVIRGVDEEGRLIIESGSVINRFNFKEVAFL